MFTSWNEKPKSDASVQREQIIKHVTAMFEHRERTMSLREKEYDRFRQVADLANAALIDAGKPELAKFIRDKVKGFYESRNP